MSVKPCFVNFESIVIIWYLIMDCLLLGDSADNVIDVWQCSPSRLRIIACVHCTEVSRVLGCDGGFG